MYKWFKSQGVPILCKWGGSAWNKIGELPPAQFSQEQGEAVIASLLRQNRTAVEVRPVTEDELNSAFLQITQFVAAFLGVDRANFTFTSEHMMKLLEIDKATTVLISATKSQTELMQKLVFGGEGESESEKLHLETIARLLSVFTLSIENTTRVTESEYSSKVMLQVAKVRQQLLRAILLVGSNDNATKCIVEKDLAYEPQEHTEGGGSEKNDEAAMSHLSTAAVVGVLHATSAKFDFTAVELAITIVRNWTIWPDEKFRETMIVRHRILSCCVALFGHKHPNVASAAVGTARFIFSNEGSDTLKYLVRSACQIYIKIEVPRN